MRSYIYTKCLLLNEGILYMRHVVISTQTDIAYYECSQAERIMFILVHFCKNLFSWIFIECFRPYMVGQCVLRSLPEVCQKVFYEYSWASFSIYGVAKLWQSLPQVCQRILMNIQELIGVPQLCRNQIWRYALCQNIASGPYA